MWLKNGNEFCSLKFLNRQEKCSGRRLICKNMQKKVFMKNAARFLLAEKVPWVWDDINALKASSIKKCCDNNLVSNEKKMFLKKLILLSHENISKITFKSLQQEKSLNHLAKLRSIWCRRLCKVLVVWDFLNYTFVLDFRTSSKGLMNGMNSVIVQEKNSKLHKCGINRGESLLKLVAKPCAKVLIDHALKTI